MNKNRKCSINIQIKIHSNYIIQFGRFPLEAHRKH